MTHPTPELLAAVSLTDAAGLLRRPFASDLVLWRPVEPEHGHIGPVGQVAPYLNRELVIDRLNVACPGLWSDAYEIVPGANGTPLAWCHLTIDGVTRSDVGEGNGKALVTDALKRAAMKFGVGVSLGAMPRIEFQVGATDRFRLKRIGGDHGDVILTDAGRAACAQKYEEWLARVGIAAYGEPLLHAAPDQRRPVRGETNAELAELHEPAPADEHRKAALIRALELSAERADVEVPQHDWDTTLPELQAMLDRVDRLPTAASAAA